MGSVRAGQDREETSETRSVFRQHGLHEEKDVCPSDKEFPPDELHIYNVVLGESETTDVAEFECG